MAKPEIFKSVIYDLFSPTFPYVSQRWIWREKYLIWSPSATCPHCASHTDDGLALMLCLVQAGLKGTKILPKWVVFTANSENISSIKVKTTSSTMNDYLLLVENAVNETAAAQKFKAVFGSSKDTFRLHFSSQPCLLAPVCPWTHSSLGF